MYVTSVIYMITCFAIEPGSKYFKEFNKVHMLLVPGLTTFQFDKCTNPPPQRNITKEVNLSIIVGMCTFN